MYLMTYASRVSTVAVAAILPLGVSRAVMAQSKVPIANFSVNASTPVLDPNQLPNGNSITRFHFDTLARRVFGLNNLGLPLFTSQQIGQVFNQPNGPQVVVFAFNDINTRGRTISGFGLRPLAIVSRNNAVFSGPVNLNGRNGGVEDRRDGGIPGPGGGLGGRGGRGIGDDSEGGQGFLNGGGGGDFIAADRGIGGSGGGFGGAGGNGKAHSHPTLAHVGRGGAAAGVVVARTLQGLFHYPMVAARAAELGSNWARSTP